MLRVMPRAPHCARSVRPTAPCIRLRPCRQSHAPSPCLLICLLIHLPSPPAADHAAIDKVLAEGRKPTSDCYTWERGGKW